MPSYNTLKDNKNWLAAQERTKETRKYLKEQQIQKYLENPKICKACNEIIPYQKHINTKKFCNRSCSAKYNNKQRSQSIQISNSLKKYYEGKPLKERENYHINPKTCLACGGTFPFIKRNKKFCRYDCQQKYYYDQRIKEWLSGNYNSGKKWFPAFIKRYLIDFYGNQCSRCSWHEINPVTGKVPVEIDHIDGNWKNNSFENLRVLCPNCHSITPTYKALNTGNGRTLNK